MNKDNKNEEVGCERNKQNCRNNQNWFILPSKTRYNTSDDSDIEVFFDSFDSYCPDADHKYHNFWKTDRPVFSNGNHSQYSSSGSRYYGGISGFFIRWWDKRYEERTTKERELKDHGRDLVLKFNEFHSPYSPASLKPIDEAQGHYMDWDQYLKKFRYRKEFLQHLLTGHEMVYTLFRRVVEYENSYINTFSGVFAKVKERIRNGSKEIGIPDNPTRDQPSFPEESIALHIVNEIDMDSSKWFEFRRDSTGARNVVSNNRWFLIKGFNQPLADNLVSKLNGVVHDPKICEDLTNYRILRGRKDECIAQFKEQLEILLRGVELKTKDLRGACDQCLGLHDEKEIRRLQPLLSQIR